MSGGGIYIQNVDRTRWTRVDAVGVRSRSLVVGGAERMGKRNPPTCI